MNKIKKLFPLLLIAVLCLALLTACGGKDTSADEEETSISVALVNRSGYDIGEIYITSSLTTDWGVNYLDNALADGDIATAGLGSFDAETLAAGFNILVYDCDGDLFYDTSFDELNFQIADGDYLVFLTPEADVPLDITADYDYEDYSSSYPDDTGFGTDIDISDYTGCWKYDQLPFYLVINEDYEWAAVNLYSEQIGPGTVTAENDGISLYLSDGSLLTALNRTAYGGLSDENGNSLTATDYIMLLPTPEDELNMTANFPGSFSNVYIDYPIQLNVGEHPSVSNALSFNARMEDGTDDYYSNIMIAFQPISGYDGYMTQGSAAAKPYMQHMLDGLMTSMYGDKLIKTIGTDFTDGGDHYSIIGYMWLDGSIFSGGPSTPVRGCMEVRYYGPTGYALVATSIALENRIRNYFDICSNMLDTCTYTAGWSTAPKTVPSQPAAQGSDPGDYGSPYYWYDEDGDVWYWNGYENEFIGYGDSYYIDDDGQYYESNDAGWDDDWDYYDEWYYYDDYDPWSDPGDGWGDYTDDDGWGDYFD